MDVNDYARAARTHGWSVTRTRRNHHWKFVSPDRSVPPIFTSGTPSDWRSIRNLRSNLRRSGLPI